MTFILLGLALWAGTNHFVVRGYRVNGVGV